MNSTIQKFMWLSVSFLAGNALLVVVSLIYSATNGLSFSIPENPTFMVIHGLLFILAMSFALSFASIHYVTKRSDANAPETYRFARNSTTDDLEVKIKLLIEAHQMDANAIASDMTDLIIAARAERNLSDLSAQVDFLKANAKR